VKIDFRGFGASTLSVSLVVLAVAAITIGCGGGKAASKELIERVEVAPVARFHPPVRTVVEAGDTIESVSRRLAGVDWVAWRDALSAEIDSRRLRPGTLFEGVQTPDGTLETLRVVLEQRSR